MMSGLRRTVGWLAAVWLMAVAFQALPQRAAAAGKVFDKMRSALSYVVSPDAIELARYTIDSPSNAADVYSHALQQDYPYFAIIGGIKYARYKGLLTEGQCTAPFTLIDKAFDYVTPATTKDKAGTGQTVAMAKNLAASYAAAASQQAKADVLDQLKAEIPYFGDLPVMCSFAFGTDFKQANDYFALFDGVVQAFVDAYHDFSDGDIASGVADLALLNLNGKTVCALADDIMTGGVVGGIPIIGDLASTTCAGAVQFVINSIKWAANAVSDAGATVKHYAVKIGCTVISLFSSACKAPDIDWPKLIIKLSGSYCESHGGLSYWTPYPDLPKLTLYDNGYASVHGTSYGFTCNDQSRCMFQDSAAIKCVPGTDYAASGLNYVRLYRKSMQAKQLFYLQQADASSKQCLDSVCVAAIASDKKIQQAKFKAALNLVKAPVPVGNETTVAYAARMQQSGSADGLKDSAYILAEAMEIMGNAVEESRFANAPQRWREKFAATATVRCVQYQPCLDATVALASSAVAQVASAHQANPDKSYLKIALPIFGKAKTQADALFGEAAASKIGPIEMPTSPGLPGLPPPQPSTSDKPRPGGPAVRPPRTLPPTSGTTPRPLPVIRRPSPQPSPTPTPQR